MAQQNMFSDGKIVPVNIREEMKKCYIDYAMSVIVGRALPDVRDGLKPVHRRILYAMHEDGITSDKPYRKCANTVGSVLGRYHPHGDASVYDAMVRMAQDFSMRYMLIDGHGNFGSIDGDGAAAMRYTEARMSKIAESMLTDIEKNTVDFINTHNIQGLKIHCTYVVKNTVLANMYYNGTYTPISLEYYLECAGYILSHINPNIVIHRVSGDAPKDLLVAPDWNSHKKWIMNGLDKYLRENDLWQGKYYNN